MRRFRVLFALALLGAGLGGCATTPPTAEMIAANDPYEPTNRELFLVNRKLDKYIVVPTAGAYVYAVPEWGRNRVHDLLDELSLPITFANDVLQAEPKLGGQTFARFIVNATLGVGGLFDPATSLRIPNHGADFGQTLGVWGLGEGPYLMLPLFGPSNPRDATGLIADYYMDPLHWLHYKQHIWWDGAHEYFTLLDARARTWQTVQQIERGSVDFYASTRSLYRQVRNNQIRHGRPDTKNLPEF
jgi:phospholipid-binding lipoprotein MlaA